MWNGFLTLFLEHELKKFNHAYMPAVGTKTGLKAFVINVLPKSYVYEFDLQGFFNNVSIPEVNRLLRERGMPEEIREKLILILKKAPSNMNFGDELVKTDYDKALAMRNLHREEEGKSLFERANEILEKDGVLNHPLAGLFRQTLMDRLRETDFNLKEKGTLINKGLPQGAAPSTILSLLALSE